KEVVMNSRRRFGVAPADGLAWINLVAGLWLVASPWIYGGVGLTERMAWNSIIVGIVIAVVAVVRLLVGTRAAELSWLNVILGWESAREPWVTRSREGRFRGRGPRGYQRSDAAIRETICERMTDHPHLDASEIDVMVAADGVVTLQGTVPDRESKRLAEAITD